MPNKKRIEIEMPRPVTAEDIERRYLDAANALTREKRQEFLDYMWSGMKLGDAREKAGVSFEAAVGIVNQNLEHGEFYLLRREAM